MQGWQVSIHVLSGNGIRAAPIALLLARGEMVNSLADSPSPNSLTSSWERDAGLPSTSVSSCVCQMSRSDIRVRMEVKT